jgi:glycosyltransferase involved in cell wall biosynthesis
MKIMNIMLSRILGGIEQSFLDYEQVISLSGYTPINVISKNADISCKINSFDEVPNFFQYDPITILKLRHLLKKHRPKFILAHGNRSMKFVKIASFGLNIKVIGISHNYNFKSLNKCDHLIALTNHMKEHLVKYGFQAKNVTVIPNCITINTEYIPFKASNPFIIGSMGRFVKKKGFDILLQAFKLLKSKGIKFKAIIGGGGEEEESLKQLCTDLGLEDIVTFCGWVQDKSHFFENIDIFSLPSLHEPFGIIMLEAMLHSKPIVTTDSEGPLEIIKEGLNGVFCKKGDAEDFAKKLEHLTNNLDLCKDLAKNAYLSVCENYAINCAAEKFQQLLVKLA